jgi:hypothetical protein
VAAFLGFDMVLSDGGEEAVEVAVTRRGIITKNNY